MALIRLALASIALLLLPGLRPSAMQAADLPVDLELVLAVDVSLSMDLDEQRLQRDGYVAAFRHPQVIAAIGAGRWRRIAVVFVEWAGTRFQKIVVPWTLIDGEKAAKAFAGRLDQADLTYMPRTSISDAISYGATLFAGNGFRGERQVIDVSGDGPNNQGIPVTEARDAATAKGITVNGLPVLLRPGEPAGYFDLENLDVYYEDCVIGGAGAFIVRVRGAQNFSHAIRRKLILEMAGPPPAVIPVQLSRPEPRIDCMIGEKLWRLWLEEGGE